MGNSYNLIFLHQQKKKKNIYKNQDWWNVDPFNLNASAFSIKQHEFSINDMNSVLFCVYPLNWPAALKVCTLNVHILSELSVITILESRAGTPVNQNCQLPVKGTSSSPEEDQLIEFFTLVVLSEWLILLEHIYKIIQALIINCVSINCL